MTWEPRKRVVRNRRFCHYWQSVCGGPSVVVYRVCFGLLAYVLNANFDVTGFLMRWLDWPSRRLLYWAGAESVVPKLIPLNTTRSRFAVWNRRITRAILIATVMRVFWATQEWLHNRAIAWGALDDAELVRGQDGVLRVWFWGD